MAIVDAVLLAGGTPRPDDPLYTLTRGGPKALLPIAGRPMAQWVLDALSGARSVRSVVVVGLAMDDVGLRCDKPIITVADQGDILANVFAGGAAARDHTTPPPTHALVVSVDVPAITAPIVDWHVGAALESDHEAYRYLIGRETMEERFPGSGRSFYRLVDGSFTGGDLWCFTLTLLRPQDPAWRRLVAARKSVVAQARIVGLGILLRAALGRLTIAYAERRIRDRFGVDARVLVCPYAEAGMDVDTPHQHALLDRDLRTRSGTP